MDKVLNAYLKIKEIPEMIAYVIKIGEVKKFKKNEYYVREGQKSRFVGFVELGGFRYIKHTSKGAEQVVGYSFENDFVVDLPGFLQQSDAVADVQAIKDSVVHVIPYEDFIHFFEEAHPKDNLKAELFEIFLCDIYERLLSLYCDSPEERYTNLVSKYPRILNQVSLKEIASFIKVTPETLSRIRKKILLDQNS